MKVCLASMAPFVGGAEVAAERLALGLIGDGHDVVLLLGQPGAVYDRYLRAGLRCVVSPMYHTDKWHWARYVLARRAITRFFRRECPDVIHSNDLTTHQIVSDAARGLGVPRVCHHRFPFGGAATDWLNKFGAERHLFVSRALMRDMYDESIRLREAPCEVVYDGLPMPPLPDAAARSAARSRLGLPAGRTVVTIAGQVIERKGVAELIRAWPLMPPAARHEADLLVVGDDLAGKGEYRIAMEKLAVGQGTAARFVGFQKDVADWLLASDVAVVPSHVEPLGNATLEAMSFAVPVVGTDVGGIPEMVVPESTGLLVPARDPVNLAQAVGRLIAEPATRQRFGAEGRRRCEEVFSLSAHVRSILQQYEAAMSTAVNAGAAR